MCKRVSLTVWFWIHQKLKNGTWHSSFIGGSCASHQPSGRRQPWAWGPEQSRIHATRSCPTWRKCLPRRRRRCSPWCKFYYHGGRNKDPNAAEPCWSQSCEEWRTSAEGARDTVKHHNREDPCMSRKSKKEGEDQNNTGGMEKLCISCM